MKFQYLLLFIFISNLLSTIVLSSSNDFAYGLWNQDDNTAVVGIINLSTSTVTPKYKFNGFNHVGRINSDFNKVTKQLQFVLFDNSLGNEIVVSFSVETWKPIKPFFTDIESSIKFKSLISTGDNSEFNLISTYIDENDPSGFFVGYLDLSNDQFNVNYGNNGNISSSIYYNGKFLNVWSNYTTNQPMVTIGDNTSVSIYEYTISNVDFGKYSLNSQTPYNLIYIPSTNQIIGNINLIDKQTSIQYAQLFELNYPSKTIENLSINSPINGLTNCICLSGTSSDSTVYAVYESNQYSAAFALVQWNLSTKTLISKTSFPVNLFNMFIFQ